MQEEVLENVLYVLIAGTGTLLSGITVLALLALAIASDRTWLYTLVCVLGWQSLGSLGSSCGHS
jgi:hypothetical protein